MAKAIFIEHFNLVVQYYDAESEVEDMKESARRDMDNAEVCFAALAKEAKEAGFIPLDTTGAIAAEVNRQRAAIAGYACDRTGMVMPARCGDCLCWEADEKRAVNRQRRGR